MCIQSVDISGYLTYLPVPVAFSGYADSEKKRKNLGKTATNYNSSQDSRNINPIFRFRISLILKARELFGFVNILARIAFLSQ